MRRLRIFIIVFGILCLVLFLATAFLNFFYLPQKAKVLVAKAVMEETGLKVELPRLSFHLLKGIALEGLKLRDPREDTLLFQARRVYVQIFWLPLVLKKEFVISSITFERPSFSLTRLQDGKWDLGRFLQKTGQKGKLFALMPRISVVDGDVLFTDQTVEGPLSKRLILVYGKVTIGLPAHLYVKGSVGIEGGPLSVTFEGSRPLNKESWSLQCHATHLSLRDLAPYAKRYLPFLESAEGDLSFEARWDKKRAKIEKILFSGKTKFVSQGIRGETSLRLTGHVASGEDPGSIDYAFKSTLNGGTLQMPFLGSPLKEVSGDILLKKDILFFDSFQANLGKTPVSVKGTLSHFGDPELDVTLRATSSIQEVLENLPQKPTLSPLSLEGPVEVLTKIKGKMSALSVSGSLEAKDVSAKGIPSLGTIEHLRGSIAFTENALETGTLTGIYEGFPFELKGTLSDFQNPFVDVTLRLTQPLKRLEKVAFFQTLPQNLRPSLGGMGRWDLRMKGSLHQLSQKDISGRCHLQNATLQTTLLPSPVEKIDGEFSFDADMLHLKGITGVHASDSFRLDGSLRQGQNPEVQLTLVTKTVQLSSQFTLQGEDLRPFSISRRTSNTTLSAEGEMMNYKHPILKLSGRWEGPVEELAAFRGKGGDPFLKELQGTVTTHFSLAGPKERPEEMAVSGDFSSPLLAYKSLQFKNVSSQYAYRQNALSLSRFSGMLWGGHLLSDATVRLSGETPYTLKMELKQANLSDVIQHFVPDQKKLKGLLFVTVQAEGELKQPQEVRGAGWFKVEEGDLFEIPMLSGLSPVLRPVIATLYPQLDETFSFHEAYAHCAIGNRTVTTENLILQGDRAALYGQGSVGFNQTVDLRIGVQFTDPQILARPTDISRLKNILVSDTGMLAGEVQMSGTLKEPKYRYRPLSAEKIPDLFRKTGSALIERLFE